MLEGTEYVLAIVRGVNPSQPGWQVPAQVYFRRRDPTLLQRAIDLALADVLESHGRRVTQARVDPGDLGAFVARVEAALR